MKLLFVMVLFFSCIKKGREKRGLNECANSNDRLIFNSCGKNGDDDCFVTRKKANGYYRYFFCKKDGTNIVVLFEDSIPVVEFLSDTLLDVNGDKYKDLILNGVTRSGQCTPKYSEVFCYNQFSRCFNKINVLSMLPNPVFYPDKAQVTGEISCLGQRSKYKFQWNGLNLDTIYFRTEVDSAVRDL